MAVLGVGPVVIHVDPQRIHDWVSRLGCLGFTRGGPARAAAWRGELMLYGRARIAVAGVEPGTATAQHVAVHGDGVADVALYVDDVCQTFRQAVVGCSPPAPGSPS